MSKLTVRRGLTVLRANKQRGAFAIMSPAVLLMMLGFCGIALDMGMVYNRKAELQGIAQSVALAAAHQLNGTSAGVTAALTQAAQAAQRARYAYTRTPTWSDSAIQFSASPAAGASWVAADTARTQPADKYYVKVDTSALAQNIGVVDTIFIRILSSAHATVPLVERAVAGRASIDVMPLAVCAMSTEAGALRTNAGPPVTQELVEYGFRRGVSYDLMQLNPHGTTPVNYVIDPLAPPGGLGAASNMSASAVAPFVCSGQLWITRLTGGNIRVSAPFPLALLYKELNTRFDQYDGSRCSTYGAPPDANVRQYSHGPSGSASWMNPRASVPSAAPTTTGGMLRTIADLPAPPTGTTPGQYGPLWSYAKPALFASYTPGVPEPDSGYSTFATTDWKSLYPATPQGAASSYPSKAPYHMTSGTHFLRPSTPNIPISTANRRLLHVPLLACPVAPGTNVGASAVAVAKFFMTVPATDTGIHAEFAGLLPPQRLTGRVTLYP